MRKTNIIIIIIFIMFESSICESQVDLVCLHMGGVNSDDDNNSKLYKNDSKFISE